MRAKFGVLEQTHGTRLHAKFRVNQFILSPSADKKRKILPFFGLKHFVVSPIGTNVRKLNMGAQTTNLSLYSGIKIISLLQCRQGEMGRRSSDVQKRDEQADTQTKKLNVFGRPSGSRNPRGG